MEKYLVTFYDEETRLYITHTVSASGLCDAVRKAIDKHYAYFSGYHEVIKAEKLIDGYNDNTPHISKKLGA